MRVNEVYVRKLMEAGFRADERAFDEMRSADIEVGVVSSAEGSARVKLGESEAIVGIKMSLGEPFSDSPNEGVLMVNAELSPVASEDFEPGPPSERAVELARVVDRGIRESHCINLEKLCVKEKELVWMVNVDLQIINDAGNLIDLCGIGAITALLTCRIPKTEGDKVLFGELTDQVLPVVDIPIPITVCKTGNVLIVDPTLKEEESIENRVTVTTNKDGNICSLQKGGSGFFTTEELLKAADISILKGREIRKMVEKHAR